MIDIRFWKQRFDPLYVVLLERTADAQVNNLYWLCAQ
jgi:hypothetical protein